MDDRDVELKGAHLEGLTIDFVVTGGIACIESPKIIRELRRYGANVRVFMSPSATAFVTPLTFEWASKNPVVTELSGSAEHITQSAAVVVAPATLDFLSKIALGFADSAAATLVQSALNRIPVFFAPAMHLSLQGNPAYQKNLSTLSAVDHVFFLEPNQHEGKAKIADRSEIVAKICHGLSRFRKKSRLVGVPTLITAGPTRSYADDIRYLSNISTGALGLAIAEEFYKRGAEVQMICGPLQVAIPAYLRPTWVETLEQMEDCLHSQLKKFSPQIGIFSAAVLDFEVKKKLSGKTPSSQNWNLELQPTRKLIQSVQTQQKMIKVGFKLESLPSPEELKARVLQWVEENPCDILVANRLQDLPTESNSNTSPISCPLGIKNLQKLTRRKKSRSV